MYHDTEEAGDGPRGCMIAEMPGHERPRERLLAHGPSALKTAELLAILLRTGTHDRSALDVATALLQRCGGDLVRLAAAPVAELCKVRGIGQAKALELRAAFDLARRLQAAFGADKVRLPGPSDVADLLRDELRGKEKEEFHVLLLDAKNGLLRHEIVTVGLVDRSHIHAREVFRSAIREGCARVLLAHNHPSGDPTPSAPDIECTRNLVNAGKIIGIDVIDHVVIGTRTASRPRDWLSFREANLM